MGGPDQISGLGSAAYPSPYTRVTNGAQEPAKPSGEAHESRQSKLDELKAQMKSGASVDLHQLADAMLRKGRVIDVQA